MSNPAWLKKYLHMKPEVRQIFSDLEAWHNYCRFNLAKFDPADLYKSAEYRAWQAKRQRKQQMRQGREHTRHNHGQG